MIEKKEGKDVSLTWNFLNERAYLDEMCDSDTTVGILDNQALIDKMKGTGKSVDSRGEWLGNAKTAEQSARRKVTVRWQ